MLNERTTEKTLTYIGIDFHVLWCLYIIVSIALLVSLLSSIFYNLPDQALAVLMWSILVIYMGFMLLSFVFTIRAAILIERKTKEAGFLLLVNGIALIIISMGLSLIQSVLFIVAGAMLLKEQ